MDCAVRTHVVQGSTESERGRETERETHTERDLLFLYIHRFFYEELAHIIMEAEKSKICSRQAGDPGESIT